MTNNTQSSEDESDYYDRISHNASVSMENDIYAINSHVSRFMAANREGHRKRGSDAVMEKRREFSKCEKMHPSQEKWSSVTFNLNDGPQDDAVSYSMSGRRMRKFKKMKVSDNDHSHGSFFLRAGAVGQYKLDNRIELYNIFIHFYKFLSFRIGDYHLRWT